MFFLSFYLFFRRGDLFKKKRTLEYYELPRGATLAIRRGNMQGAQPGGRILEPPS